MSEYIAAGADDVVVVPSAAPTETVPMTLEIIGARTAEILQRQKDEDESRKWAFFVTLGGALFAAVRLGIIAIPKLRSRVGGFAQNPARRRVRSHRRRSR
jgi:hypothetical protein